MSELSRVSYKEFDIYGDIRRGRIEVDRTKVGRRAFNRTRAKLSWFPSVSEVGAEDVARADAREAEYEYLKNLRRIEGQYTEGEGIGLTALFTNTRSGMWQEVITGIFVPNPAKLGAPEVMEVEVGDQIFLGLHVPQGHYQYSGSRVESTVYVDSARDEHGDLTRTNNAQPIPNTLLVGLTDSAGAFVAPEEWKQINVPLFFEAA